MKKIIILSVCLLAAASLALAATPTISLTTVLTNTANPGPYTIRTVVKSTEPFNVYLGYQYNNEWDVNPRYWPFPDQFVLTPDSAHGDTFYFLLPAVPESNRETPVEMGYAVRAEDSDNPDENAFDPSSQYYHFLNLRYTPQFTNVNALRDTFFTGPYIVKANINTLYGDSVTGDNIYTDLGGGTTYNRDSLGGDGFYYYSIPRVVTNSFTPMEISWFLTAYDTMGNWAQWPVRRDTMNHFKLSDPLASSPHTIANTDQTGPFPVWATYQGEGQIVNDSLWVYNNGGGTWDPYARDSLKGDVYYYTIPQQEQAVINPVAVQWYLKASDSLTGNYTFLPVTEGTVGEPYSFRVYDWTGPVISDMTRIGNTAFTGPFQITATCRDTSGISQVRVYFRAKPSADTSWNYLPMYPTGNPDEYQASLPVQSPGMLVQYYVSARDGALKADGTALWNTTYGPAGGMATPHSFYTGSPQYKLLLVNDGLAATNYNDFYTACLDTNGVTYGYWDNRKASVLPQLQNFNTLVWFTGDDSVNTLDQSDRDSLTAFLNRGGNLLLSSKNLGQSLGGKPNSDTVDFYHNYLKVRFDTFNISAAYLTFIGKPGLPISKGIKDTLYLAINGTAGNYKSVDRVMPLAGADSLFTAKTIGGCGVVICSTAVYKTVYSSLPLEAVAKTTAGRLSRTVFIGRVLNWFGIQTFYKVAGEAVSETGLNSNEVLLYPACPNPFGGNTVIGYNLPTAGRVSLKVYNVQGQLVRTVCDGQRPAGISKVTWNGDDDSGNKVSKGIYLYRLVTKDQSQTKKVIVLR
jgi:hypothetical protein